MGNASYNDLIKTHIKTLDKYVPVVDRVHGDKHPEFHDVRKIYETISEKTKEAKKLKTTPNLHEEFIRLRKVTNNYTVPDGVCETFEAVYKMLCELDSSYNA